MRPHLARMYLKSVLVCLRLAQNGLRPGLMCLRPVLVCLKSGLMPMIFPRRDVSICLPMGVAAGDQGKR